MEGETASVEQQRPHVAGTIYCAVSKGYDKLRTWKKEDGVFYELRTSALVGEAATLWNRIQKINLPPTRGLWSCYLDGSLTPKVPLRPVVEGWLEDAEMALFRHPHRNCAYEEIDACVARGKISKAQAEKVRANLLLMGLPKKAGLWACGMIARRTTSVIQGPVSAAWVAFVDQVPRDQLWLPLVLRMIPGAKERIKTIDADIFDNEWFTYRRHGT
ncbi:MAG: hypothetical protein GY906_23600 [bacterium]|nr:hypothetical protein [bacterium]